MKSDKNLKHPGHGTVLVMKMKYEQGAMSDILTLLNGCD